MNKPRLPFDIEFLMESVLKETPDFIMGVNDKSLAQWDEGYGKIYAFMTKTYRQHSWVKISRSLIQTF